MMIVTKKFIAIIIVINIVNIINIILVVIIIIINTIIVVILLVITIRGVCYSIIRKKNMVSKVTSRCHYYKFEVI